MSLWVGGAGNSLSQPRAPRGPNASKNQAIDFEEGEGLLDQSRGCRLFFWQTILAVSIAVKTTNNCPIRMHCSADSDTCGRAATKKPRWLIHFGTKAPNIRSMAVAARKLLIAVSAVPLQPQEESACLELADPGQSTGAALSNVVRAF